MDMCGIEFGVVCVCSYLFSANSFCILVHVVFFFVCGCALFSRLSSSSAASDKVCICVCVCVLFCNEHRLHDKMYSVCVCVCTLLQRAPSTR